MLHHVLVPLDGSSLAENALDMAKRVLKPGGKITLLASVNSPGGDLWDDMATDQHPGKTGAEVAHDYLDHLAKNLMLNGHMTDIEVAEGDPAELIVERARVVGVEAVVMTTHGRSGLSRLLFGSVTTKVLENTPCPVIVVPNRVQERVEEPRPAEGTLGLDLAPE